MYDGSSELMKCDAGSQHRESITERLTRERDQAQLRIDALNHALELLAKNPETQ